MAGKKKLADMQSNTKPKKLSSQLRTKVPGFVVPQTAATLNRLSRVASITSINDLPQNCLGPGSDVTQKQFLALRIIYPGDEDFLPIRNPRYWDAWGLEDFREEATKIVNNDAEFKTYLRLISNRTSIKTVAKQSTDWPGSLKPLKFFQEQIQSLVQAEPSTIQPSYDLRPKKFLNIVQEGLKDGIQILSGKRHSKVSPENSPPAIRSNESHSNPDDSDSMERSGVEEYTNSYNRDESYFGPDDHTVAVNEPTPNAALIILLQAILDLVFEPSLEWTLDPVRFCSNFRNGKFNAYTDGALRATVGQSVFSIVEAKRGIRTLKPTATENIRMQEGAEMASWIMSDPGDPRLQKLGN